MKYLIAIACLSVAVYACTGGPKMNHPNDNEPSSACSADSVTLGKANSDGGCDVTFRYVKWIGDTAEAQYLCVSPNQRVPIWWAQGEPLNYGRKKREEALPSYSTLATLTCKKSENVWKFGLQPVTHLECFDK